MSSVTEREAEFSGPKAQRRIVAVGAVSLHACEAKSIMSQSSPARLKLLRVVIPSDVGEWFCIEALSTVCEEGKWTPLLWWGGLRWPAKDFPRLFEQAATIPHPMMVLEKGHRLGLLVSSVCVNEAEFAAAFIGMESYL